MRLKISLSIFIAYLVTGVGVCPAFDRDVLRAVADAYDENRAKFSTGNADFEYADGFSDSLADAENAELRDQYIAHGRYCFDANNHVLFEKRYPLEAMIAATNWSADDRASSRLDSQRLVTNGKLTFHEVITPSRDKKEYNYGHIIKPGTKNFFRLADFPLGLACPEESRVDLARHLRMILNGDSGAAVDSIDQDAVLDGVKVVRLSLRFPNGTVQYWVDLERGAIPLRRHDEIKGGSTYDVVHGDLKLIKGHGWLPFKKVVYLKGGRTKRLVVTSADFDVPPGRELFRIEIENERSIANLGEGVSYSRRKVFDLDNLPASSGSNAKPLAKPNAKDSAGTPLPGELEPRPPYFTIIGVLVGLAIGSLFVAKRLRG
jgi:hypothetical protein